MNNYYDTIIVGAGPAGLSAALYLLRAGYNVLIIDKDIIFGGQMAKSPLIENYPGFKGSGADLADKMSGEVLLYKNVTFKLFEEVTKISRHSDFYHVETENDTYYGKTVIWAVGTETRKLNVPGEDLSDIHYCVTCDGPLYKDKYVAVIGDGNSAVQYALELSKYCNAVYLLTMFDKIFAEPILQEQLINKSNIDIFPNFITTGFESINNKFISIKADQCSFLVDGVFIAIGQIPHNEAVKDFFAIDEKGFITSDLQNKSIIAVGDCVQKPHRQVVFSAAEGAEAALKLIDYLRNCSLD